MDGMDKHAVTESILLITGFLNVDLYALMVLLIARILINQHAAQVHVKEFVKPISRWAWVSDPAQFLTAGLLFTNLSR
jgi:hypothetical protein